MRLFGWRVEGSLPDLPRMVIAAGPHTSNWDFLVGVGAMYAAGFKVSFLGKDTLFRPPLGWIMRWLGGNRSIGKPRTAWSAEYVRQIRRSRTGSSSPSRPRGRVNPPATGERDSGTSPKAPNCRSCSAFSTMERGRWDSGRSSGPAILEDDMGTIQDFYATKTPKRPENFLAGDQ